MENNNDGAIGTPRCNSRPKVHSSMCSELTLMLDKVSSVLPLIEAAQPGCKAGIEELCNLYSIVDKGKLIVQNCIECSSLYLAITGEASAMRCERIRNSLRRSLFLIQNMVPSLLANQVADIHNDLRDVKFIVDPEEEEAGKAILEMLRQSDASQELELQTFLLAASKLNLTSPKAILIERRAIKKLLDKINGNDPKKEGILKFFQYLVRKYGKNKLETDIKIENVNDAKGTLSRDLIASGNNTPQRCFSPKNSGTGRYDCQNNFSGVATPPEFCCPISMKLMSDPVIIASGQTYERENIERWFNEGYDYCPRTQVKLENFTITPNTCMKVVICNWCKEHELGLPYLPEHFHGYSLSSLHNISAPLVAENNIGYMVDQSTSSFALSGSSYISSPMRETDDTKANCTQLSLNTNYQLYLSFGNFDKEMFLNFFHDLSDLPIELQRKAVRDLKNVLNGENQIWRSMISNGFLEAFLEFLKNDNGRCTAQAQKTGIQFFLTLLSNSRTRIPSIREDAVRLIVSFLDSELRTEALLILHELLQQPSCQKSCLMASVVAPSVIGALDTGDTECLQLALKIISELSSNSDMKPLLISSGIIPMLSPILSDGSFADCCLQILRNLSIAKEAADLIIRTNYCLASISDYLDAGSCKEREHASAILLMVCSSSIDDCVHVLKEGVIPALVDLSVNGTEITKATSIKLLQLLRDSRWSAKLAGSSCSKEASVDGALQNSPNGSICKQPISKSARYISRKLNIFSKPRSLTLV